MFLENAYREYSLAPLGERSRVLRHWIRAWFGMRTELPAEFEDAACDLLPEVKSRAFYHLSALETQLEHGAAPLMSYKLIGEHLGAAIVYDMPHQMLQISQEHLDRWGVTRDEAMQIAKNNLASLTHRFSKPGNQVRVYVTDCDDDYGASRLLLAGSLQQLPINGSLIAIAATRQRLFFTGSNDIEGLRIMLSESQRVIQTEPHVVSGIALRMEANMWKPWLPEPDHPLFDGFKTMQAHSFARAYEQQQRLLNRIEDRNIFVAKCSCIRRLSPERANTFCTWTSGITSWLPRTDWIAFVQILDENTEQVDARAVFTNGIG